MSLKSLPRFLDGALFGALLVPLMFSLKIFCPITVGCFADPFVAIIFSPLILLERVFGVDAILSTEIILIISFWAIVWGIGAHLFAKIQKGRVSVSNSSSITD